MREILGVLVPFFAIVALGYGAARFRLIWQSGLNGLNAYLFNFALPVILWAMGTYVIPLSPFHLKVGVAVAALPTGVNLYLFSSRYLRDVGVFSAAILSSTVISVASLAFVVWLLARP